MGIGRQDFRETQFDRGTAHAVAILAIALSAWTCASYGDEGEESSSRVRVTVQATDPNGRPLSYQWRSTDGRIANVNAATTTWRLADGPGLHFAYVLVSNGAGGYTERRLAVNTDTIGAPFTIPPPLSLAPPPASAPAVEF